MRLLHARTLELKTFFDNFRPTYLILSHRWIETETNLHEFEYQKHLPESSCNAGVLKVKRFCAQALDAGHEWVWVDTCCIDKSSSAELTEAINSMWRWYRDAHHCYVYMNDIEPSSSGGRALKVDDAEASADPEDPSVLLAELNLEFDKVAEAFKSSAWWTRGWTLQELLAPRELFFYDANWGLIGERDQPMVAEIISSITHIDPKYFGNLEEITGALVADRMSWISKRKTSRIEDLAYCMLGIFDVHMPLIYGEGWNAFFRLQLEIIAKYDDETIFCWRQTKGAQWSQAGMLAPSPIHFSWIFEEKAQLKRKDWIDRGPYRMTNKGLELEVFDDTFMKTRPNWPIPLNVMVSGKGWICIQLDFLGTNAWCRTNSKGFLYADRLLMNPDFPDEHRKRFTIYVRQLGKPPSLTEPR